VLSDNVVKVKLCASDGIYYTSTCRPTSARPVVDWTKCVDRMTVYVYMAYSSAMSATQ